jgi:hypothetical protein
LKYFIVIQETNRRNELKRTKRNTESYLSMQSLVSTFQTIIKPLILPAAKYCPQGDQVTILSVYNGKTNKNVV